MAKNDLLEAYKLLQPHVHRTPVLSSHLIDELAGCKLYFKCENFQRMGAFKMRGAVNAIMNLSPGQQARGVVTHSSGNFAQALSLAAKSLGVKAYIAMPSNAPEAKKAAVRTYGGIITLCDSTPEARESTAAKICLETGATFIHPSNDYQVILGQGTAALELIQDHPNLDALFVPVGGGGLIAGSAIAAKYFSPVCIVIGAEPKGADDAFRSLKSGKIELNQDTDTIADGLRTNLGDVNFPIIRELVKEIVLVSDSEIVEAMKLIFERMKIVIEPSAATALAGLLRHKENFKGKRVGIVLSGGNVDLSKLPFY
ncbi:MAG: pyridoxal-phosphate dependent enzyme [Saprospirales bacterium]|nr:MAG: pyridoxal-phosphate dependent enzyme [Saprospirales bacterium]